MLKLIRGLSDAVRGWTKPVRRFGPGDDAPPLLVSAWLKGPAIELNSDAGRHTVVCFFASWCPGCQHAPEVLHAILDAYPDRLQVVAISDEPAAKVQAFIDAMADEPRFSIALDDRHQTSRAYFRGAGVDLIPYTFVISPAGKLVWHCEAFVVDSFLVPILAGEFSEDVAAWMTEEEEVSRLRWLYLDMVSLPNADPADFTELGEAILASATRMQTSPVLNNLAWNVCTDVNIVHRDLLLAERAARRAVELAEPAAKGGMMDTLARVLWTQGRHQDALAAQQEAVQLAPEQVDLLVTLEAMRAGELPAGKPTDGLLPANHQPVPTNA